MPDHKLVRREGTITSEGFYKKLKPQDAIVVRSIVETIQALSIYPFSDFFGVYGIGGNVTRQGERPDIDLLVATNAHWIGGYNNPDRKYSDPINQTGDWIAGTLQNVFEKEGYKVELKKKIPSKYDGVGASHKGMIRLTPLEKGFRKPIDVVIAKINHYEYPDIKSLADFERVFDIDEGRKPLPRVLLFER